MKKLTIKGKEYPIQMTLGAMVRFKAMAGKDVSQIGEDISELAMFMYCTIKSTCAAQNIDFELEFEPFCDNVTTEDLMQFQEAVSQKKTTKTPPIMAKR